MLGRDLTSMAPVLGLLAAAGCTSASLPALPPAQPQVQAENAAAGQVPVEIVSVVAGTPTEVYALVARGALKCWFGPDGPLGPSHVFHAEAEPPAEGGKAEIVLHERDEALRDKRGARSLLVSFSDAAQNVRVAVAFPKMDLQLAQAMVKDVASWAKGGGGCELRAKFPSPPPVVSARDHSAGKKR